MKSRETFLKKEITLIKKILDRSYYYCQYPTAVGNEIR